MITLSLLHPIKQIPVQVWTFENESVIRIGRSTDNQVILYSAVVSRHHVELRRVGSGWEIINLGTNGTYLDGKRITQVPVTDGAIIRLARSGPNIKIRLGAEALKDIPDSLRHDRTVGQRGEHPQMPTEITERSSNLAVTDLSSLEFDPDSKTSPPKGVIPVPPHLKLEEGKAVVGASVGMGASLTNLHVSKAVATSSGQCDHARGGGLFCVDCGQPLQVLQAVGSYDLVKVLGQGEMGITYHAWRAGEHLVVKTLNAHWVDNEKAREAFECEAETVRQLSHPQLPHLLDFFLSDGKPYLVMELMPGQTLAQWVSTSGPLSLERSLALIGSICSVLEYLHSFVPPVLHRSLRPNSVLLQARPGGDRLSVVDLGAVKSVVLEQGVPAGYTGYAAPEQMALDATPATDLYALGPLLAFLVTGQNPVSFYVDRGKGPRFDAASVQGLPPAVVELVNRLTEPAPENRWQSAREVAEQLATVRATP